MENKYNLELKKEDKVVLDCAIWLYYHTTMENIKDKKLDKWEKEQMKKDMEICKNLIDKIKELK